ncbi:hypothetical protein JW977_00695, partial [Candidatus Falkowbacteria bacterium]|nr:hypothetical protein [Candidatus Falkowbacteria bacterium]
MAIDFLGKPKPVKKKIGPEVKYHVPEKEKAPKTEATKKEAPAPAVKKVEAPKPQELSEADLITAFKKKMRRKKLIIACLIILICLGGIIGGYFLYNYIINLPPPPPPPVVKYLCNSTTGQCSLDESGTYDSLSACQASCFAPPPIPVCGNGICETNENSENCASDCPASVVVKYSCNTTSGQCFADANGTYTTLSACQASCFAP